MHLIPTGDEFDTPRGRVLMHRLDLEAPYVDRNEVSAMVGQQVNGRTIAGIESHCTTVLPDGALVGVLFAT